MNKTLPEFIVEIGDHAAAELFGVKLRTVQSWRRRERYPYPRHAHRIVKATGGKVSHSGIYAADEADSDLSDTRCE